MARQRSTLRALCLGVFAITLAACSGGGSGGGGDNAARLDAQLSPIVANDDIRAFLAEEATRARVSRFRLDPKAGIIRRGNLVNVTYGITRFDTGSRRSVIQLNTSVPDATGLLNITHEIGHAAANLRGCFGHDQGWIDALYDIAKRFEARFPGIRWGSRTPVASVDRRVQRMGGTPPPCRRI